ncbi:acyl-CoA synthetase short-chain family member 3, mitochondrial [Podospora conica]|nr:acyl-CoA synthetase short-chain family member 3, mitochondrial [Schizothecium conicum]
MASPPSPKQAQGQAQHPQDLAQHLSLTSPAFWAHQASLLDWAVPPSTTLALHPSTVPHTSPPLIHDHWTWFPDGELSTCYNCLDRHVLAGRGDHPAILYDSPVTSTKQRLTYAQLLHEVEVFAGVLREQGVKKGDVVLVYMPMIPAALVGILAVNRLGAVHAVVFGGFAATALAQRMEAAEPRAVLTASCGVEGGKGAISYQGFVEEAVGISTWKPERVVVWQREELRWEPVGEEKGERDWRGLVADAERRGVKAGCVPTKATDPVYLIYTSGTTGTPKGVVRENGGHAVGLMLSIRYMFGIMGPGDVMGCFSDIGWVVSHSYTLYAPLLAGAATVLYEGKPVGTPDASAFWRLVDEYKINTLFTAPTALRAIRKADPDNTHLTAIGQCNGLRSLRALFLAGERSEPALITTYQPLLTRFGAPNALVIDNWWSSESGSPISGIALSPHSALPNHPASPPLPTKPGSAGKPLPGFDVRVVNDAGAPLPPNTPGNIVLALPLAPTAFRTLHADPARFHASYLSRFSGRYLDTGDSGLVDAQGYVHILGRSDDIINVAAHRLSTGALEQAITSHPRVTEACVVPVPDELKGSVPFAFVVTSGTAEVEIADDELLREINVIVRRQVGGIAAIGGMVRGDGGMIPRTRSGKTLRRVLRGLVENAVHGEYGGEVEVPVTVEDAGVVEVARGRVKEYFEGRGRGRHGAVEGRGGGAKL